jgi:predicted RNA-binding protein with PUA-like domain
MNHWLLKSEPGTFSIDDLAAAPRRTTAWDGVRNYQARNTLRDSMKKGDTAFFYHSSCEIPGYRGHRSHREGGLPGQVRLPSEGRALRSRER